MTSDETQGSEIRCGGSKNFHKILQAPKPIKRQSTVIVRGYKSQLTFDEDCANPFSKNFKCEKTEIKIKSISDEPFGDFERGLNEQVDESFFKTEIFSILNGEADSSNFVNIRTSMPPLRVANPFLRNFARQDSDTLEEERTSKFGNDLDVISQKSTQKLQKEDLRA